MSKNGTTDATGAECHRDTPINPVESISQTLSITRISTAITETKVQRRVWDWLHRTGELIRLAESPPTIDRASPEDGRSLLNSVGFPAENYQRLFHASIFLVPRWTCLVALGNRGECVWVAVGIDRTLVDRANDVGR